MVEKKMSSDKGFIILIVSIAAIIFVVIGSGYIYKKYFSPKPQTIEEMLINNYKKAETEDNYIYNGFSFIRIHGTWYTQVQRGNTIYNLMLNFGPREVENISITGNPDIDFLRKGYVYLTFDPYVEQVNMPWMAIANSDIAVTLIKVFNITTDGACTRSHPDCEKKGARIIDCNSTEPVIFLNVSNETKIEWHGSCLVINGREREIDRAATRFLYKLFNIIN